MDLLNELEDLKEEDVISALRKETIPLVMWGAGSSAPEVQYYLRNNGIIIADVFVDDEYYTEGLLFEGKAVLSYSMLKEKYDKVNVILGNSNYEKKGHLEKKPCITHVYCLFSISYNVFEKTPVSEIKQHIMEFEEVYGLLEDDKSRNNLTAFIKTRVSGNNQYIMDVFEREATFYNNEIFQIGTDEVYLDVGAFDGDTIRLFLKENNVHYKYIYAVEPDEKNYRKLEEYVINNQVDNIEIKKLAAWNDEETLNFSSQKQISSVFSEDLNLDMPEFFMVSAVPLDNMFVYKEPVTFLKINYFEGVKEALEGAALILKNYSPKLAITVGFDCRNIRCVPSLIKRINSNYKLYLRFNRGMSSGLTLYALV